MRSALAAEQKKVYLYSGSIRLDFSLFFVACYFFGLTSWRYGPCSLPLSRPPQLPREKDTAWQYFNDDGLHRLSELLPDHVTLTSNLASVGLILDGWLCFVHCDVYHVDRTLVDAVVNIGNDYPHVRFYVVPLQTNSPVMISPQMMQKVVTKSGSPAPYFCLVLNGTVKTVEKLGDAAANLSKELQAHYTTHRGPNLSRNALVAKIRQLAKETGASPAAALEALKLANAPFNTLVKVRLSKMMME